MWDHKDLNEEGKIGEITPGRKLPGQQAIPFPLRILHD